MVKNIFYWVAVFLLALMLQTANGFEERKTPSVSYNSYVHNYAHPLPSDYVYRTGRVFSPNLKKIFPPVGRVLAPLRRILSPILGEQKEAGVNVSKGEVLRHKVRNLTAQLLGNAGDEYGDNFVVTVSTFVNLNRLYQTSALGRYFSEQLITELQFAGVRVIDVRKSPGIMIRESYGEYGMSRDMEELSYVHASQVMIVGTYSIVDNQVFINARMLRNPDGMVLSSASLVFGLDSVSHGLLADEGMPVRTAAPVKVRQFPANQEMSNDDPVASAQ